MSSQKKSLQGCQQPVNQIELEGARLPWGQAMPETCVKGVTLLPGRILRANHRRQEGKKCVLLLWGCSFTTSASTGGSRSVPTLLGSAKRNQDRLGSC